MSRPRKPKWQRDLPELKPCPFCGETPDVSSEHTFQTTQGTKWGSVVCCCYGPEARTGYGPPKDWAKYAVEEWNKRKEPQNG